VSLKHSSLLKIKSLQEIINLDIFHIHKIALIDV
jgi:hypothetical protein